MPGSFFHTTECFGPVLGVMVARTLDEAIAWQNATAFGLTGGLHSLDDAEIARWLERVEVGNAYVNRAVTGAIVQRQPFGGWKDSSVGPGAKAGGPNYLTQLGRWLPEGLPTALAEPSPEIAERVAVFAPLLDEGDIAWLRTAVGSDAVVWAGELGVERDASGLAVESNVLRYRPLRGLTIRACAGSRWVEVIRVLLAAELVGTPVSVSVDPELARALGTPGQAARGALRALALVGVSIETDAEFASRLVPGGGLRSVSGRVRAIGDASPLATATAGGGVTILTGPVLAAGRRELLTVLREQAVSRTKHRFGHLPTGA